MLIDTRVSIRNSIPGFLDTSHASEPFSICIFRSPASVTGHLAPQGLFVLFQARSTLANDLVARSLITTRTASASTADAFDFLILLQLLSRYATDARAIEVGLLSLDAAQAAKLSEGKRQQAVLVWYRLRTIIALTFS